jgi:hypothetical protein
MREIFRMKWFLEVLRGAAGALGGLWHAGWKAVNAPPEPKKTPLLPPFAV